VHLFTNRYKGGVDTYLQVINAETTELANERNAIDILRRRGRERAPGQSSWRWVGRF
jgi:outer membrane protein TolC